MSSSPPRKYRSPLREGQARATRSRILEALAAELSRTGLADLVIARVAERAGVSERTVYRHFPTRDDLLAGLLERYDEAPPQFGGIPEDLDELPAGLAATFAAMDDKAAITEAILGTEVGRALRARGRQERNRAMHAVLEPVIGCLDPAEQRRIRGAFAHVVSAYAWRTLRDEFGMDGREAGETVALVTGLLIDHARRRAEEGA